MSQDAPEVDAQVLAVFDLLQKRDFAALKQQGAPAAEAASNDEPWFEPDQIVKMLSIWLDACMEQVDLQVLEVTSRCLRHAQVEESVHPGFSETLQKVAHCLDVPGTEHLESLLLVRAVPVKLQGDKANLQPLVELLRHRHMAKIHDAMEIFSTKFFDLSDSSDDEVAALMAMTIDLAKYVSGELSGHTPGDMAASKNLAYRCQFLCNLLTAAMQFCATLIMGASSFPLASSTIAAPATLLALQDALRGVKPKPKEEELRTSLKSLSEMCQQLLAILPKPTTSSKSDAIANANAYVKALSEVQDAGSLSGILNMMSGMTDSTAVDILLGRDCLLSVVSAFERVKKSPYETVWQALPKFLVWAVGERPSSLEPVADRFADFVTRGPPIMVQPKVLVEVLTEQSPVFARKIWDRLPNWRTAVQESRGTPMHEGALYAVISSLQAMPRVLAGSQLQDYCMVVVELAGMAKGTTLDDAAKCVALAGIRSVVSKDKQQVPKEVLDWIQRCKSGFGSAQDVAERLLDAYEGKTLRP